MTERRDDRETRARRCRRGRSAGRRRRRSSPRAQLGPERRPRLLDAREHVVVQRPRRAVRRIERRPAPAVDGELDVAPGQPLAAERSAGRSSSTYGLCEEMNGRFSIVAASRGRRSSRVAAPSGRRARARARRGGRGAPLRRTAPPPRNRSHVARCFLRRRRAVRSSGRLNAKRLTSVPSGP